LLLLSPLDLAALHERLNQLLDPPFDILLYVQQPRAGIGSLAQRPITRGASRTGRRAHGTMDEEALPSEGDTR
jgi:hypothetical protein